ncbi:initiation factor 2 [Aaosphaeria arxii CBS 175.79]|uniref:Translation initiation factor IF-2, mitochondrial n=1 Tax=Aaosphaeria arxii CBS 175.79 TaxID=1450172 RepID=A0A6A5Y0N7_9PLEO|nr:initiation factor 2 [Aaosphaeria arxii CBS 175.79]KAF2018360.1 initiation factor 2 [Aaosphaeria arxii CBS 175.79]
MHRAQGLRVSSPRDICIFCATRQLAVPNAAAFTSSLTQRRHITSSNKAPHPDTEAQLYKEERPAARPLTQAERLRQSLLSQQPTLQRTQQSRAPHHNANSHQHNIARRTSQRSTPFTNNRPARNQSNDRFGQRPRDHQASRQNFKVDMGSSPPITNSPQFGQAPHLRRRNAPLSKSEPINAPRAIPKQTWDQSAIDELLGNNSSNNQKVGARTAPRLSRGTNSRVKCFTCGQEGHTNRDCPNQPVVRQNQPRAVQAPKPAPSLRDEAEAWARKNETRHEESQMSGPAIQEDKKNQRNSEAMERRRRRFAIDEAEPEEARNRYEAPQRRQRGANTQRFNRVMRDEEELSERVISKSDRKRERKEAKKAAQMAKAEPTPVSLPEFISVANLATVLKLRVEDFVRKLEELGFEEVQNDHILNAEHAGLIAQEYNFEPIFQDDGKDGDIYPAEPLSPEEYAALPNRPPVVTIMGHVDHGKTTILDFIRKSSVAAGEFGGITQHIGAFSVPLASGKKITFLDTPGHAAFETMRARGANVTDIVVLVVAADDSVMPQTVEAIKHAQAAKVPIIVAINKIDRAQADPDNVKLDLGRHGLEVEDFGGDIQTVLVSGKTGQGIADLEEAITTQSEILDHRADPVANVEGWVLEGTTKKSGKVATVLVRNGTLRPGQCLVAGKTWTRVRSLRNENGAMVQEAGPGMPVEVDGWREQPIAGDEALQAQDDHEAAAVAELRTEKIEREQMAKDVEAINESRRLESERREAEEAAALAAKNGEAAPESIKKESGPEIVNFIVKADVSGSAEAVIDSIVAIGNNEVGTRILRHGVGSPSEFDVQHAADASGHIVNFNTVVPPSISSLAALKGVKILDSNIIYRVVENVKELLSEKLAPKITQKVTGEVEIAAIFEIGLGGKKTVKVAGSKVRNGIVKKNTKAKVLRGDVVVFDGIINSLKSQKKEVDEMRKDTECGIGFENWEAFKIGDKIQCYDETKEKRTL